MEMKEFKDTTRSNLRDRVGAWTGRTTRIRMRPPDVKNETYAIPAGVFGFDSAFPNPGVAIYLREIEERGGTRLMVFGHTDRAGSESYNKKLADRRAQSVLALLLGEVDLLVNIGEEEQWGLKEGQAMLRSLGCNPGPIDGIEGSLTRKTVQLFQEEYNQDIYHSRKWERSYSDLVMDGVFGPRTREALCDAYVSIFSPDISRARLTERAFAGCGEFNPPSEKAENNRRVVVASLTTEKPREDDFPCREGDVSSCLIDDGGDMRCRFYRRYIHETPVNEERPRFFDYQWLREEDGRIHLSALTSLPDGTQVSFTIYRAEGAVGMPTPNSASDDSKPPMQDELGRISGEIAGGVCFARWSPSKDFDPYDFNDWLVNKEIDAGEDEELQDADPPVPDDLLKESQLNPPVFLIEAEGHWGVSPPPSFALDRLRIEGEGETEGLVLLADGTLRSFDASEDIDVSDNYRGISLAISNRNLDVNDT